MIQTLLSGNLIDDESWNRIKPKQCASLATEKALLNFITNDDEMLAMKDVVRILSNVDESVLILGDTGTGKELIAKALHGSRKPSSFFAVNCAGIPMHIIESELFGHVRGSFTGANCDKPGLFRAAEGGTVFLDEIGELPLEIQAKLLRVIQEKKVRRVGDYEEFPVNFRCVCATHHNLEEEMMRGKFREDLFYRISTFIVKTKSLSRRPGDVELILKHLLKSDTLPAYFDNLDYNCRGNVRYLQQQVLRYKILGLS